MASNNVKHLYYACEYYFDDLTIYELDDALSSCQIPSLRSPIHEFDTITQSDIDRYKEKGCFNEEVHILGAPKKKHVHVMFLMPYNKQPKSSLIYINENLPNSFKINWILGIGFPPIMMRYFCHLDNPEKFQYPINQLKTFHDFPLNLHKPSPPKDQRNILNDLRLYIMGNNTNITRLIEIYKDDDDMLKFIVKNTYFIKILIQENWG